MPYIWLLVLLLDWPLMETHLVPWYVKNFLVKFLKIRQTIFDDTYDIKVLDLRRNWKEQKTIASEEQLIFYALCASVGAQSTRAAPASHRAVYRMPPPAPLRWRRLRGSMRCTMCQNVGDPCMNEILAWRYHYCYTCTLHITQCQVNQRLPLKEMNNDAMISVTGCIQLKSLRS